MMLELNLERTSLYVKKVLENAEKGHDWWHIHRVFNLSKYINQVERGDKEVIQLSALLHDISDAKFNGGDEAKGALQAKDFLHTLNIADDTVEHIFNVIKNISYKGGNATQDHSSLELDIVQDADRLDAMGAIGIARTFHYGGYKNRDIYDPHITPNLNMTPEEYRLNNGHTINHFYEKLLLLKDRMNTETGKVLAEQRHSFMVQYLEQFFGEWNIYEKG